MKRNEIGQRLKELRIKKALTQEEVAAALNTSRTNYTKMEAGERDLKTDHCIALADFFETTCDYLLTGVEADSVDFCKQTGLSYNTLQQLTKNSRSDFVDTLLNALLRDELFQYAASDYNAYCQKQKVYYDFKKFGIDQEHTAEYWETRGLKVPRLSSVSLNGETIETTETNNVPPGWAEGEEMNLEEQMDFYLYRCVKALEECIRVREGV